MNLARTMEESMMRLRQQVPDFPCEHCNQTFCDPRLLKRHKEKLHGDTVSRKLITTFFIDIKYFLPTKPGFLAIP